MWLAQVTGEKTISIQVFSDSSRNAKVELQCIKSNRNVYMFRYRWCSIQIAHKLTISYDEVYCCVTRKRNLSDRNVCKTEFVYVLRERNHVLKLLSCCVT